MRRAFFLLLITGCATGGGGVATAPPPKTLKKPFVETLHGVEVSDPFRSLEDGENPDVRSWADAQNERTRKALDARPSRAALRARVEQLVAIGRLRTPQVFGSRVFYSKRTALENQPVLYVRDGFTGTGRRLVDPNTMSADGTVALDWWHPSPDGSKIAYGTSEGGSEQSTLRVKDVETGKEYEEAIPRTRAADVAWLPDQSGFYYTQFPAAGTVPKGEENYHRRIFFHKLGTSVDDDNLVFGETRAKEDWPGAALSRDGRWLIVEIHQGWSKSEIFVKDLQENSRWAPVVKGMDAQAFGMVHQGTLYLMTNWKAPRFRIVSCAPTETDPEQWKELVPEGEATMRGFEIVGEKIVIHELRDATSRLRMVGLDGQGSADIELPGLGTVWSIQADPAGSDLVFDYTSFFSPTSLYRFNVATGALKEFERLDVAVDAGQFESKQVRYTSKDGTSIPMFLLHKKGVARDGNRPTILTGYGGFGISITPNFNPGAIAWMEKGGVFASPNLRGGGEYGEAWHKAGMLENKQNSFDDFIAAAEWLVKEKVTSPGRLAIEGGSNGGLLVGAALTQRPDLFRAVVCGVPLLDMVRYHKFQIARLWIPEYGDPDQPEQFKWLYAYSPYHKVKDQTPYPAVLLLTAEKDTRVDPLHARKMCARLQEATSSGRPILLRFEKKAGHGAGKPLSKAIEELADEYAFLAWQLGVE
jgi:prolyl oligopeptidase